jgi:hypothetical protein
MTPAFVTAAAPLNCSTFVATAPATCVRPSSISSVSMMAKKDGATQSKPSAPASRNPKIQDGPKIEKIPQGFTQFSELLNSRVCMLAFFLSMATEVLAPGHPGSVGQVGVIFEVCVCAPLPYLARSSPLTHHSDSNTDL